MDPLSVVSSVLGIAGLAYSSSKALYQLISDLHDAPQDINNLQTDLGVLCQTIQSIRQGLEQRNDGNGGGPVGALADIQAAHLTEIEPALEGCRLTCDEFAATLDRIMRHNKGKDKDQHMSLRDRIRFQFKDKEIASFRSQLASYKLTLAISLQFLTLQSTTQDLDATRALESKIEDAATRLAGQIQGLQIGLQTFLNANVDTVEKTSTSQVAAFPTEQESRVLRAIEQQNEVLGHCYKACIAALRATTQATGNTYRYVSATDEAKLLVGNVGDVAGSAGHQYEEISAAGNANVILGNMQGDYMRDFFR